MIEVQLNVSSEEVEQLEALFCESLQQNWLLFQKNAKSQPSLRGYFESEGEAKDALAELKQEVRSLQTDSFEILPVDDQDWKMAYRHHLKPWKKGRLNWVPVWEKETFFVEPDQVYVYLDSGMAFGTGSHETTRLCAEALYDFIEGKNLNHSINVMDVGCGSGVLAMSASRLGFESVYAFDRDPEAVKVTVENLEFNGMTGVVEVLEAGIEEGVKDRQAHIIMVNIQADVLMIYVDELVKSWNPDGGIMILSGILAVEVEQVKEVFAAKLAEIFENTHFTAAVEQMGEWVSLVFEAD